MTDVIAKARSLSVSDGQISSIAVNHPWPTTTHYLAKTKINPCTSATNTSSANVMHLIWPTLLPVTDGVVKAKSLFVADEHMHYTMYFANRTYQD